MNEKLTKYEDKMKKTLENLTSEFGSIRAGRANPHVLDRIMVNYYGTLTPIQQVGNVSVPDPKSILISPWDAKIIKDIEKAIQASDIGINPSNDGRNIRLVFPDLTEERRKDLAKDVKKKGEDAKVAVRNIRRDAIDQIKKDVKAGDVPEDSGKDLEDEMQKLTDKYIKSVDGMVADKTKEVMTV